MKTVYTYIMEATLEAYSLIKDFQSHENQVEGAIDDCLGLYEKVLKQISAQGYDITDDVSVEGFLKTCKSDNEELYQDFKKVFVILIQNNYRSKILESKFAFHTDYLPRYKEIESIKNWGTIYNATLSYLKILYEKDDFENVIRLCNAILDNGDDYAYASGGAFSYKVKSLIKLGKYSEAEAEYLQLINRGEVAPYLNSGLAMAYYFYGDLLEMNDMKKEALKMYKRAHELNPEAGGPLGKI